MSVPAVLDQNKVLSELGLGSISMSAKVAEKSTGVKPSNFLPFIQLLQKTSKDVGDHKAGSFILKRSGKDPNPIDLGNSFEALVVAVRGKATYFDGKTVKATYHTAAHGETPPTEYVEMRDLAKKDQTQSYRVGLDVLFYIPSEGAFALYFANSPTAISQVETEFCPLADNTASARVYSELKTGSKGSWYLPKATELDSKIEDLPRDLFKEAVKQFLFPVKSIEESIDGAEAVDSTVIR